MTVPANDPRRFRVRGARNERAEITAEDEALLVPVGKGLFVLKSAQGKVLSRPLPEGRFPILADRARDIATLNESLGDKNNERTAALLNYKVASSGSSS